MCWSESFPNEIQDNTFYLKSQHFVVLSRERGCRVFYAVNARHNISLTKSSREQQCVSIPTLSLCWSCLCILPGDMSSISVHKPSSRVL